MLCKYYYTYILAYAIVYIQQKEYNMKKNNTVIVRLSNDEKEFIKEIGAGNIANGIKTMMILAGYEEKSDAQKLADKLIENI